MSAGLQIALALGSVAVLLGLMALVRRLAIHAGLGAEVQRKLVHVGTGLYAMALPWLFPDRWPVYLLIAITLLAMALLRTPLAGGLGSAVHSVERKSYGDFLLAASVGLCFFLADGEALFYLLPIAVLTLADAAAALAGTSYGRKRFQVEDGVKSLEGSVVFFTVTLLISLISFMFLSDLPPGNILALSLMVAAFGTLVEAQSWRGFDNFFLPLGLLVFLSIHSQSSLMQLAGLVALFLAALFGFGVLGRRLGLTPHASRVYVVAMFLILAVVEVQNALLPALVLLGHAFAARRAPGEDAYGELDVVAALALISFGWLALGNATGWNAVAFYGLSAGGLALGLIALAVGFGAGITAALAGILALREGIARLNPAEAVWAEPLWPLAIAAFALPALAALLRPGDFAQNRVAKLTALALLLPVVAYTALVLGDETPLAQTRITS